MNTNLEEILDKRSKEHDIVDQVVYQDHIDVNNCPICGSCLPKPTAE